MGVSITDYDCSGYATKNDLRCSDGRIIRTGAFKANDGDVVPLVWNHQHDGPQNILGHALLSNRDNGVYSYLKFNNTEQGQNAKELVMNGDIDALSIFANQLKQNGSDVTHGNIREVSLVLAGANPGAYIDCVIEHGEDSENAESAVIYTGETLELYHADKDNEESEEKESEAKEPEKKEKEQEEDTVAEKTVGEVYDTLTDEQKKVVEFIIGQAVEDAINEAGGEDDMAHNLFEGDNNDVLMHAEELCADTIRDAKQYGSMKESFLQHSVEYGIEQIDWLQPEYKDINGGDIPFIKRQPDAWASVITAGVHHTPFSKVKMMFADLRADEARAKGYAKKGKYKVEEVITLLKRQVSATTVYKKQKLDRDDVIEITDMNVVAWLKGEMRMMLDEELARAYVFGDGRTALDDDKIDETHIIPVCKDADLYTIKKTVTPAEGQELADALIDAAVVVQDDYEGSGNITCFMESAKVTAALLLKDKDGRRLYKDINELATAMNVNKLVKVPAAVMPSGIYAIGLDLSDYNVGADKGGAVNMFDDFDIDYNQQKYLIETRCSACLTKPYSAFVLKAAN